MNVLNKIGSQLSRHFSTLTTDAVSSPSRVQVTIEDVSDASPAERKSDSPPPPVPPLRRKANRNKNKDSQSSENLKHIYGAVNTQATGNVINVINSNGFHWGPDIVYNIGSLPTGKPDVENNHEPVFEKTKLIVAVMDSNSDLEHGYIDIVSKQLGADWRGFFRHLDYKDGMLDLMYESHQHKGIPEVIYQILLDWTRTGKRTLGELTTELWNEGRQSVVCEIAELYKSTELSEDFFNKEEKHI